MTAAFAFFFLGSAIALTKKASWMPWAGGETKTWLYAHVTAHAVGVGLACAGLVEIFTGRTYDPFAWEGADGVVKAHGVLGMIVACAPALQAAFAYAMRNDKKKKKKHARDDDDGDDAPPPKTSAPRRAHVVGGWVVVLGGSINVVVGASLLNDQTGEDASAFSAVGWALAIASIAAVAAARGRGFCREEKTVRDY
jgi:predicted outer membrane lipoprotein